MAHAQVGLLKGVFQNFRRASPPLSYVSPPGKKYTYCVTLRYISCSVTRHKKKQKSRQGGVLVAIFFPFNLWDGGNRLTSGAEVPV